MVTKKKPAALVARQTALSVINTALEAVNGGLLKMAELLSKEPSPGAMAAAYHLIDKNWKKVIEAQREGARAYLLSRIVEEGEAASEDVDSEGLPRKMELTVSFDGEDYKLVRQCSATTKPSPAQLLPLLQRKGISVESACDAEVTYKPNMDKLNAIIAAGKISQAEVSACYLDMPVQLKAEKL